MWGNPCRFESGLRHHPSRAHRAPLPGLSQNDEALREEGFGASGGPCRPALRHSRYGSIVAFVMTTVSLGTSLLNGPLAPVGTLAIASTTSIPETTLPNTA